jgi:hypothetical protein
MRSYDFELFEILSGILAVADFSIFAAVYWVGVRKLGSH